MELDMERVMAICVLRRRHEAARLELEAAARPLVRDLGLMPALWEAFSAPWRRAGRVDVARRVPQRKMFLFAALYLYCPRALAGGKMTVGLRDALAEAVGLHGARTPVSDNCSALAWEYRTFPAFAGGCRRAYSRMAAALRALGR